MKARKLWTQQEDQILRTIVLQNKIKSWSIVAKILETEFKVVGRTGKQCRQRWHNNLDPKIKLLDWSQEQENNLFYYHNKYGNKWVKIANHFIGRSDNCVKNNFYSIVRKAFRCINRYIIKNKYNNKMKPFKNHILSLILNSAQSDFCAILKQKVSKTNQQNIKNSIAIQVKNRLFKYSQKMNKNEQDQSECEKIINAILQLCQSKTDLQANNDQNVEMNLYNGNNYQDEKIKSEMQQYMDIKIEQNQKTENSMERNNIKMEIMDFKMQKQLNEMKEISNIQYNNRVNASNQYVQILIKNLSNYFLLNPFNCNCYCDCINKKLIQLKDLNHLSAINVQQNK